MCFRYRSPRSRMATCWQPPRPRTSMCCLQPIRTCAISRIFPDAELRSLSSAYSSGQAFVRMFSASRKRFDRQLPAVIPRSIFRQSQSVESVRPNTEVKPRRADCTARESVWESRSLPALIKATFRNECGLFLLHISSRSQMLSYDLLGFATAKSTMIQ